MSKFFRFLVTITAIVHLPFAVAMGELARRLFGVSLGEACAIGGGLALVGVWLFVGRTKTHIGDTHKPFWKIALVDLPYYAHWAACLFCLIPSLVYLLGEPLVDAIRGAPIGPVPGFFLWCYAVGLVVCTWGVTLRRWWFVIDRVEVPIRGLDPKLDGYRIAQLSDLHVGSLTPGWWAHRWARAANAEKPDLTVVTGDMVTSGTEFHADIARVLSALRAPDGVFAIMGNHDYFGEGEPLVTLVEEGGVQMLRNRGVVLEREGAKLFLSGVDDTWTRRADMHRALEERPDGMPTVLLLHDPDKFPQAVAKKCDLVLSGHTHGGQIAVPFLARHINASKLAHHFHLGIYKDGDSTLYVHPGLGTTGPPIRLGVAPCVTILTLRAA